MLSRNLQALLLMFHSTPDSDPLKRKLYFGQIVAFYLSSRNSSLNSTTTTTHGRLAFMMLEKAAQEPTQSSVRLDERSSFLPSFTECMGR